jgi:hypothetical protein
VNDDGTGSSASLSKPPHRQVAVSLGRWRGRQLAHAFCHWRDLATSESRQRQVVQHFAARRQQQLQADAFACLKQQVGCSIEFQTASDA